jgi:hypothetical protein
LQAETRQQAAALPLEPLPYGIMPYVSDKVTGIDLYDLCQIWDDWSGWNAFAALCNHSCGLHRFQSATACQAELKWVCSTVAATAVRAVTGCSLMMRTRTGMQLVASYIIYGCILHASALSYNWSDAWLVNVEVLLKAGYQSA